MQDWEITAIFLWFTARSTEHKHLEDWGNVSIFMEMMLHRYALKDNPILVKCFSVTQYVAQIGSLNTNQSRFHSSIPMRSDTIGLTFPELIEYQERVVWVCKAKWHYHIQDASKFSYSKMH